MCVTQPLNCPDAPDWHFDHVSLRCASLQAYLALEPDGQWRVTNAGRRPMHVDGKLVEQFGSARANHLSLIEVGTKGNKEGVQGMWHHAANRC